jgi:NDP-sugar pyrophosphorylase family protein
LGVIETDNNDCLTSYKEKPETEYKVSMGVYVYEPEVLEYIEPDVYLDFPNLVTRLLESGEKVVGYPCSDLWLDIGNHEDYIKAQKVFEESKYDFLPKDVS